MRKLNTPVNEVERLTEMAIDIGGKVKSDKSETAFRPKVKQVSVRVQSDSFASKTF
jgi:hypothetical protein